MLLGKEYTRIKRSYNAASVTIQITTTDGAEVKIPRKLNMLAVLKLHNKKVNKKAADREINKIIKGKQSCYIYEKK